MRNSTRQLKLLAKINLMGEFENLLWQSIANCRSPESSKWKTGIFMHCIGSTKLLSGECLVYSLYQSSLSGLGGIHNNVAIDTVIHSSCCTLRVQFSFSASSTRNGTASITVQNRKHKEVAQICLSHGSWRAASCLSEMHSKGLAHHYQPQYHLILEKVPKRLTGMHTHTHCPMYTYKQKDHSIQHKI